MPKPAWEEEFEHKTDQEMYLQEVTYHHHINLFKEVMRKAEEAMRVEEIDPEQVRRVLHIMMIGMPSAAVARRQMEFRKEMIELIEKEPGALDR